MWPQGKRPNDVARCRDRQPLQLCRHRVHVPSALLLQCRHYFLLEGRVPLQRLWAQPWRRGRVLRWPLLRAALGPGSENVPKLMLQADELLLPQNMCLHQCCGSLLQLAL